MSSQAQTRSMGKKPLNNDKNDGNTNIITTESNQLNDIIKQLTLMNQKLAKLEVIENQLKTFNDELKSVIHSQEFLNQEFEAHKINLKATIEQNNKISEENHLLKHKVKVLEFTIEAQGHALNDLEQYGRKEMIEIMGIPQIQGENTDNLIFDIGKKLDLKLDENDIEISHRLSSHYYAPIIAKFNNRRKRDLFYQKAKDKELKLKDIGILNQNKNRRIYINKSLTKMNRDIFSETKLAF